MARKSGGRSALPGVIQQFECQSCFRTDGVTLSKLLPHDGQGHDHADQADRKVDLNKQRGRNQGAITYQLRRLRLHGLIERTPKSFRYQVTDLGLRVALFFTRIYNRLLRPSLAAAFPQLRAIPTALKRAFDALVAEIDTVVDQTHLAAQNLTPLRKSSFVKHG
jgi:hypothetical protein